MNPFEFVIAIIALSFGYGLLNQYLKRRQKAPDKASLERLDMLEQRVEVLERILTDRRHELDREFDALRRG